MPPRFGNAVAPRIKPVAAKIYAVDIAVFAEHVFDNVRKGDVVLRIFDDRHKLFMLVRLYTRKAFEHFVAFDLDRSLLEKHIRKDRSPNGVGMQNRPGLRDKAVDHQMDQRFRRRLSKTLKYLGIVVEFEKVGLVEIALFVPLAVTQIRKGFRASSMLKLPLVPSAQPRR